MKSAEVRRSGNGQLAVLLAHLGGSSAYGQYGNPVDVTQLPLAVFPGCERLRLRGADGWRTQTDGQEKCESNHCTESRIGGMTALLRAIPSSRRSQSRSSLVRRLCPTEGDIELGQERHQHRPDGYSE